MLSITEKPDLNPDCALSIVFNRRLCVHVCNRYVTMLGNML